MRSSSINRRQLLGCLIALPIIPKLGEKLPTDSKLPTPQYIYIDARLYHKQQLNIIYEFYKLLPEWYNMPLCMLTESIMNNLRPSHEGMIIWKGKNHIHCIMVSPKDVNTRLQIPNE